ncbi:hypothetical protein CC2G_013258 [Coprinopsis cinerea AmutBmut pab1-1]|nr:hypothetical protein CC2G_013258 [Coprinopsis cinerea AmutBmut pab1-1]
MPTRWLASYWSTRPAARASRSYAKEWLHSAATSMEDRLALVAGLTLLVAGTSYVLMTLSRSKPTLRKAGVNQAVTRETASLHHMHRVSARAVISTIACLSLALLCVSMPYFSATETPMRTYFTRNGVEFFTTDTLGPELLLRHEPFWTMARLRRLMPPDKTPFLLVFQQLSSTFKSLLHKIDAELCPFNLGPMRVNTLAVIWKGEVWLGALALSGALDWLIWMFRVFSLKRPSREIEDGERDIDDGDAVDDIRGEGLEDDPDIFSINGDLSQAMHSFWVDHNFLKWLGWPLVPVVWVFGFAKMHSNSTAVFCARLPSMEECLAKLLRIHKADSVYNAGSSTASPLATPSLSIVPASPEPGAMVLLDPQSTVMEELLDSLRHKLAEQEQIIEQQRDRIERHYGLCWKMHEEYLTEIATLRSEIREWKTGQAFDSKPNGKTPQDDARLLNESEDKALVGPLSSMEIPHPASDSTVSPSVTVIFDPSEMPNDTMLFDLSFGPRTASVAESLSSIDDPFHYPWQRGSSQASLDLSQLSAESPSSGTPSEYTLKWRGRSASLGPERSPSLGSYPNSSEWVAGLCEDLSIDFAQPPKKDSPRRFEVLPGSESFIGNSSYNSGPTPSGHISRRFGGISMVNHISPAEPEFKANQLELETDKENKTRVLEEIVS